MKYITNRIERWGHSWGENICNVIIKGFHQMYTKNFYKSIRKRHAVQYKLAKGRYNL